MRRQTSQRSISPLCLVRPCADVGRQRQQHLRVVARQDRIALGPANVDASGDAICPTQRLEPIEHRGRPTASGAVSTVPISTAIRRGRPACCARAASGHAIAEPAIPPMNSRRRITAPWLRSTPTSDNYIRVFRPAKWGLGVGLHGSNPEPFMSAFGS